MGWTTGPNLVVPTRDCTALVWGNTLTLVGGTDASGNTTFLRRKFTLGDTAWTAMSDAPYGISANLGLETEKVIYFFLLWDRNQKVTKATDEWTAIANATKRTEYGALAWDGNDKVLVSGGVGSTGSPTNYCAEYSISTNTWVVRTSLPKAMYSHGSFYYDGYYYVVGGESSSDYLNKVWKMQAVGGTSWIPCTSMPKELVVQGFQGSIFGTKYYLCGGSTNDFAYTGATNTVYSYDIPTDTWKKEAITLPKRRCYGCCVNIGGKMVLVGGMDETANPLAQVDIFTFDAAGEIAVSVSSYTHNKLSTHAAVNKSTVLFSVSDTCSEWEARATPSTQTPARGVGLLVGSGGTLSPGVAGTFDVEASELTAGDGVYQITVYAKDASGSWW